MVTIKKSEFKKLYDIACDDWKKKFDEKLKEFLFSDSLNFEDGFVEEMKTACNATQLKVFLQIFKNYKSSSLIDVVKSYSDVCKQLNEEQYTEGHVSSLPECYQKKQLAFLKIQQIEKLFNQGWKPDFKDSNQYKYYPYFEQKSSGVVFYCSSYFSYGFTGLVAFYKSEEISNYVGKTFIDIYKDLM